MVFRIVYCISKEIDFFLHQISNNCCINIFCNTYVRAVCSVSCTKCIVYKYITKRSKFFAECISVLCLFCSVTCILKKNTSPSFISATAAFAFGPQLPDQLQILLPVQEVLKDVLLQVQEIVPVSALPSVFQGESKG